MIIALKCASVPDGIYYETGMLKNLIKANNSSNFLKIMYIAKIVEFDYEVHNCIQLFQT